MKKDVRLVAITTIDGESYMVLSAETVLRLNGKYMLYSDDAIKVVLDPISEQISSSVFKDLSDRIKKAGAELLKNQEFMDMRLLDFRKDEKYRIYLQRKDYFIMGMVLRHLTKEELKKAEDHSADSVNLKKKLMGWIKEKENEKKDHLH